MISPKVAAASAEEAAKRKVLEAGEVTVWWSMCDEAPQKWGVFVATYGN